MFISLQQTERTTGFRYSEINVNFCIIIHDSADFTHVRHFTLFF